AEPYAETERLIGERRAAGLFADMGFTIRRPDRSCHPEGLLRNARSVVVAARSYARPEPAKPDDEPRGRMPRYTRRDEYAALRQSLESLGRACRSFGRGHASRSMSTRTTSSTARRRPGPGSRCTARTRSQSPAATAPG